MRRFEYIDGKSNKFWEVEQIAEQLHLRWGKIATTGQSQEKQFADQSQAYAAMEKLVKEKVSKGYQEISNTAASVTAPQTTTKQIEAKDEQESLDQQIERGLLVLLEQVANTTLLANHPELTPSKIRNLCKVNDQCAEVITNLFTQIVMNKVRCYAAPQWHTFPKQAALLAKQLLNLSPNTANNPTIPNNSPPWLKSKTSIYQGRSLQMLFQQCAYHSRQHPCTINKQTELNRAQLSKLIIENYSLDLDATDPQLKEQAGAAWLYLAGKNLPYQQFFDVLYLACSLQTDNMSELLIDYFVTQYGLATTLSLYLQAQSIQVISQYHWQTQKYTCRFQTNIITPCTGRHQPVLSNGEMQLRAYLSAAPADEYKTYQEQIHQALTQTPTIRCAALSLVLPEFNAALIERYGDPHILKWLTFITTSQLCTPIYSADDYYVWNDATVVYTLLQELGTRAVPYFAPHAEQDVVGEALTYIGTPEAIELLAKAANSSRVALSRFNLAAYRWPAAAIAALAKLQASNHKNQSLFTPSFIQLIRKYPELLAQLEAWIEPAANRALHELHKRLNASLEIANANELPSVLVQAPWLKASTRTASTLAIEPLTLHAIEQWDAPEKARIFKGYGLTEQQLKQSKQDIDDILDLLTFPRLAYTSEREQASNALKDKNIANLASAWRSMEWQRKKQQAYYQTKLRGRALARLPNEIAIPFWNLLASEIDDDSKCIAARFGLAALPGLVVHIRNKPMDELALILHFGHTDLAPFAARAFAKSKKQRDIGQTWLQRFPEHAACGLITPALSKPSEAQECAASALRWLANNGHRELLQQVAQRYQRADVMEAIQLMLDEAPLNRFPAKRTKLPEYWQAMDWPRPCLLNGKALPDEALNILGDMLSFPTTEGIYPGITQVKDACTPASLAEFSWACFSAWLNAGAPSKESWMFTSLGLLGNDDTARKLTPYIRTWPGEAAHARAVTGLDILANIGSDVALMMLNGIAQKVKFKGLQERANEKIAAIAEARGLTSEELDDRLVPDLGLDEQGSLLLDFGTRAFKVGFDENLKPYVYEWQDGKAGARLSDLPKAKKTDDAEQANAAIARFKTLKKDVRAIAAQQPRRLEQAMCKQRRWPIAVFEQFIVKHPLVCHLARSLVWGVYDIAAGKNYGGKLHSLFRVAEDGSYSTADDDLFELAADSTHQIGLPHALELSHEQSASFAQLFADYQLLQPFQQLGRATFKLTPEEQASTKLSRWSGVKVPTGKILGLVNQGWQRGPAQDGGSICTFEKVLPDQRIIELALEPGIIVGMVDEYPEQTLHELTLGHGSRWGYSSEKLDTFDSLNEITASELVLDMERLR